MATLNPTRWGYILGVESASVSTARTTGSLATNDPTANKPAAIQYLANTQRGTLTYAMIRTFLYFDTSAITGTVSIAKLGLEGVSNTTANVIVLESTAFGGDGASALDSADFYTEVDYNTAYSSSYTQWSTGVPFNSIPLNSTAETAIQNNDEFIVAIVEYNFDYSNTGSGFAQDRRSGVEFDTAPTNITLTYTETGGAMNINGIDSSNIDKWDGTAWSNIFKINGITANPWTSTIWTFDTQTAQTNPASDWAPSTAYTTDGWVNGQSAINGTQWTTGIAAKGMNADSATTPSNLTGPNGGMTAFDNGAIDASSTKRYLYKECTNGYNAYDHVVRLPGFNFSSVMSNTANDLRLVFWYHAYGSNITPTIYKLWHDTATTSNANVGTLVNTLSSSGNTMASGAVPYIIQQIDLNAYRTSGVVDYFYIQIPNMSGYMGDVAIDSVYFEEY